MSELFDLDFVIVRNEKAIRPSMLIATDDTRFVTDVVLLDGEEVLAHWTAGNLP